MQATFTLDSFVTLEIGGDAPRTTPFDRENVSLQLSRRDMPMMRQSGPYTQEKVAPPPIALLLAGTVFYGPHPCDHCGCLIIRTAVEDGGHRYDYPEGPIYPSTEWVPHVHRDPGPEKTTIIFSTCMKPSHARAIASALLSAANEHRD